MPRYGPPDAFAIPRFAGPRTFMRPPRRCSRNSCVRSAGWIRRRTSSPTSAISRARARSIAIAGTRTSSTRSRFRRSAPSETTTWAGGVGACDPTPTVRDGSAPAIYAGGGPSDPARTGDARLSGRRGRSLRSDTHRVRRVRSLRSMRGGRTLRSSTHWRREALESCAIASSDPDAGPRFAVVRLQAPTPLRRPDPASETDPAYPASETDPASVTPLRTTALRALGSRVVCFAGLREPLRAENSPRYEEDR